MSDMETVLKTGGVSTGFITVAILAIKFIKNINNKRFHSSCCGAEADIVIAVNEITEDEKKHHTTPVIKPQKEDIEIPEIKV